VHRSSSRRTASVLARLLVAILAVAVAAPARAQRPDSTRRVDSATVRRDTIGAPRPARAAAPAVADEPQAPISARRAFFYSALVPGLGQTKLDSGRAGAVFFTTEIVSIAMAFKSAGDLRFARAHAKDSVVATYQFNADGTVQLDSLGLPVPATFAPNRYAAGRGGGRPPPQTAVSRGLLKKHQK
jgi:hypothetical protein